MTMATQEIVTVGDIVDRLPQVQAQAPEPVSGSAALMKLIERAATSSDFDVAKLEKLLEVKDRWEAGEARKAFVTALNAFKADAPTIVKNKEVSYGEGNRKTSYRHATLDQICDVVGPALAKHGLSHRWEVEQGEHEVVRVTVILQHALGHSERVTLSAKPDASGSKNAIQAVGSATTYLSRYTLLLATGLATEEQDDDGKRSDGAAISDEQKQILVGLLQETGSDVKGFLKYIGAETVDEIPAAKFANAKAALEKKKGPKK